LKLTAAHSAPLAAPSAVQPPIVSESAEPVIPPGPTVAAEAPEPPVENPEDARRLAQLRAIAQGGSAGNPAPPPVLGPAQAPAPPPEAFHPSPAPAPDWHTLARQAHVVVYTATWCNVCRRAKKWLDANGVSYDDRDIEASSDDARTLRRLNPRGSIPTFDVEGQVMIGFSEAGFVNLVQRARGGR
jgi:glutaredoxin